MNNNTYTLWEQIIDKIIDNKTTKEFKNFLIKYAAHHAEIEQNMSIENSYNSTLPMSLNILMKLNLENIKLNIIDLDKPNFQSIKKNDKLYLSLRDNSYDVISTIINIDNSLINSFSFSENDMLKNIEYLLIEENVKMLNKMLKDKEELSIYLMVSNINISNIKVLKKGIKIESKNSFISLNNSIKIK